MSDPTPQSVRKLLLLGQPNYERWMAEEAGCYGVRVAAIGPGWALAEATSEVVAGLDLCFAHRVFLDVHEATGESVNQIAASLAGWFFESLRGERIAEQWPCCFLAASAETGLGRRVGSIERAFLDQLGKKIPRLAKLAVEMWPRSAVEARGVFAANIDFKRTFAARSVWQGGQRRMADDPAAPSRSFLKVEEAYGVLSAEPKAGEWVVDLGAAPGGWSYSAAKRGANVLAIDNGPLKAGAAALATIEHLREDAFRYRPAEGQRVDWLFCDLVEDPQHVARDILYPWLENRWCRRFVVNLKLGRAEPLQVLEVLRDRETGLGTVCSTWKARHLYHDREEITLVGEVGS